MTDFPTLFTLQDDVLTVTLPTGKTMAEINDLAKAALAGGDLIPLCFGKDIKVTGRCTTALAILLGHELAHVCKSVSMFDPKENDFVLCIKH